MANWTQEDVLRLKELRSSGKPYSMIAKELNRSIDSIEQKCIRLLKSDKTLVSRNRPKDTNTYNFDSNLARAGLLLWWAEGTKGGKSVQFVNSSPDMLKVYVKFLHDIGIDMSRLKAKVKVMDYSQIESCQIYWSKLTGIPLKNFNKPIVRGRPSDNNEHKGCLTLTYSSVNLKKQMEDELLKIKNMLLL